MSCIKTGDFMSKVPQLPVCTRDRSIVSIERVYTQSTKYMKSAVHVPMHVKSVRG